MMIHDCGNVLSHACVCVCRIKGLVNLSRKRALAPGYPAFPARSAIFFGRSARSLQRKHRTLASSFFTSGFGPRRKREMLSDALVCFHNSKTSMASCSSTGSSPLPALPAWPRHRSSIGAGSASTSRTPRHVPPLSPSGYVVWRAAATSRPAWLPPVSLLFFSGWTFASLSSM